jgi:hypothetical protein
MPFTAPDPSIVADHVLPDGSSICVRKGWLGSQMWTGQKTLALEHRDRQGRLLLRSIWAVGLYGIVSLARLPRWPPVPHC